MSILIRRERCPKCAERGRDSKGDNLAIYDDHKYCFSCGFAEFPTWKEKLKTQMAQRAVDPLILVNEGLDFPADFTNDIPQEPLTWLRKYGITDLEIKENRIGWSEDKQYLIYPVFDEDRLLMWQGRYFGGNKDRPRYFTKGKPRDILHILGQRNRATIILVEDLISAIKVSRVYPSMPLWGSDVSIDTFRRLARQFSSVGVWLDSDKYIESVKLALRGALWANTFTVKSLVDPKEYSNKEIVELVTTGMGNAHMPYDSPKTNQTDLEVN